MTDAYNSSYAAADTAAVSIDLIVGVLSALFSFVTLIGLVILWNWLRGRRTRF